ncbi:MAG: T9SS type A sorting domain-containing protein, partial [Candidatus Kapabacteria bacterium]|nr:T9SS type A sorting domain-containing protein [Candidatus Kapabacteria bacterium]
QDSCATTDAGWNVWWLEKIWSENYSLTHPNIAQGGGVKIDPNDNATNISDSSVVINFSINPPRDTRIMQLQCGYWSVSPNFNLLSLESLGNDNAFKPYIQDLGLGAYPHISAQPSVTNSSSWTINRRIYTPDWESTSIISSADYFYKKKTEDVNKPLRYSGYYFERDSNKVVKTLLSTTKVGSQEVQFTPRHTVNGTTVEAKTDTVYSTWFQVGNISTLDSYVLGINNPCVKIEVERRREGNNDPIERFLLPYISSRSDKEKLKHRYILHRGGNKYYRIALINTCSERMKFTEEIQIDGLTAQDELGKQNVAEEFTNTIDLGNGTLNDGVLFLKPNPADQLVQVTFNGLLEDIDTYNFDYNYEVVDNLGRVKQKGLIRAGEIIQVNTSQFNQGSYLVRVRGSASSTSKPFVIIR